MIRYLKFYEKSTFVLVGMKAKLNISVSDPLRTAARIIFLGFPFKFGVLSEMTMQS